VLNSCVYMIQKGMFNMRWKAGEQPALSAERNHKHVRDCIGVRVTVVSGSV